ncbi:MAG: class I SAM-dependent methyltransferase [Pseudomonadota bacterium]
MDWNAMAAPWLRAEAQTDASHAPVLHGMLDRAALQPGERVLDIGPGGGISLIHASAAVGASGHVTGVEIAPPFAERAEARTGDNVSVIVADAQTHAFESGAYDVAISMFGVMFFADNVAGFDNIRRAVKPGGRLSFCCWGPPEHNPWFSMAAAVATDVLGPGPAFDRDGPGPMRFGDRDVLATILSDAGWQAQIETTDLLLTPMGSPDDVAEMQMTIGAAASRMGAAKEEGTLTPDHRNSIRAALREHFADMVDEGSVRVPARIHFVTATT